MFFRQEISADNKRWKYRPEYDLSDQEHLDIRRYFYAGFSIKHVAWFFGVSENLSYKLRREYDRELEAEGKISCRNAMKIWKNISF